MPDIHYVIAGMDERKIFRGVEGETFTPKPLLPIGAQIVDRALELLKTSERKHLFWVDFFHEELDAESTLHLVFCSDVSRMQLGIVWPEILRSLPKDRRRLAYLKAFQVLMGLHKENLKVLEKKDLEPK